MAAMSFASSTRSVLLSTRIFFTRRDAISVTMARSCGPISLTSTSTSSTSIPSIASSTLLTMYSPSRVRGLCRPGVSRKTICQSGLLATPMMRLRVVCGLLLTMATFSPTIAFIIVDLPTFGRPTIAANPERNFFSLFSLLCMCSPQISFPSDAGPKPSGRSAASVVLRTLPSHVTSTSSSGANS